MIMLALTHFIAGGQLSVPNFEKGKSEKNECLGGLKRIPATGIFLFVCLGGLVKFCSAWVDINNCWVAVCKGGQYQGWHYV